MTGTIRLRFLALRVPRHVAAAFVDLAASAQTHGIYEQVTDEEDWNDSDEGEILATGATAPVASVGSKKRVRG